jgi:EAL domain-containing protein (putative c-di-GMP-specific phosphodiesterase class I)
MNASWLERLQLENELRRALEHGELEVCHQPKVALTSGLETLLRWRHPERGILAPAEFRSLAEETGLALEMDRWVLQAVAGHLPALRRLWGDALRVSVNLSTHHLLPAAGLAESVAAALKAVDGTGGWLELEILEGWMMPHGRDGSEVLWTIREMGVGIAIDDLGTGYSNLSYLRQLPINTVKIGQSIIRDITSDPSDAAMVEAVTAMTRTLGLKTVAEGIETAAQVEFVLRCG